MAKKNQIPLPDGTAVDLPAWASETTLVAMAQQLQRTNVLTDTMLGGVKELKHVDKETIAAITKTIKGVDSNAVANADQAKDKKNVIVGAAGAVAKTANFFGDAEKPLSSMVGAVNELVNKVKGPGGKDGLSQLTKTFPVFNGFMSKFGGALNVASDVVLALAGWNAAKFEQFAEVQKKMIDSGAIFYSSAGAFDELYSQSFKAGITYNAFSDTIQNFGGTMTALGGDVSMGSKQFLGMFKSLSDATNSLGDLGMKNTELMNSYAAYIETQRLGGVISTGVANQGANLEKGFQDLVVEATSMASLTALNRGDILQRQMAAVSDTFAAAGLQNLREGGMHKQAAVAESFLQQLSLIKDQGQGSEYMERLAEAMNVNINQFSGDISKFDIRTTMSAEDKGAFEQVMKDGFFDRINDKIRTGNMSAEEASNFLLKEFQQMDTKKYATAGAGANTIMAGVNAIQNSGIQIKKNMGQYINLSVKELAALDKETRLKLEQSGTTIEAMNDMAKIFLSAQNAITLPINRLSTSLEATSEWFAKNSEKVKNGALKLFGTATIDDGGPSTTTEPGEIDFIPADAKIASGTGSSNVEAILDNPATLSNVQEKVSLTNRLTQRKKDVTIQSGSRNKDFITKQIRLLEEQIAYLSQEIKADEDKKMAELADKKRGHH